LARKKRGPTDPETIALRAGQERARRRAADADPRVWGPATHAPDLPTGADIEVVTGARMKVVQMRRASDAFTLLHDAWTRSDKKEQGAGLTDAQHQASERYVEDALRAAGVQTHDRLRLWVIDNGGGAEGVTQGMIDASWRIRAVHRESGRASAELLAALAAPITGGQVRVWRVIVKEVTGETDRHAQAAAVRSAVENLRLAYQALDRDKGLGGRDLRPRPRPPEGEGT
jgi:hypothetical protein